MLAVLQFFQTEVAPDDACGSLTDLEHETTRKLAKGLVDDVGHGDAIEPCLNVAALHADAHGIPLARAKDTVLLVAHDHHFLEIDSAEDAPVVPSVGTQVLSLLGLFVGQSQWMLYGAIALMGLGNSNPFSIIMARAMRAVPGKENEASGLMIMGLFGGTIFPLLMGFASDSLGQAGAIAVMALGVLYLLCFWGSGKKKKA